MISKSIAIDGILIVMKSCWDLPTDCNEGELYTYAEALFDRIQADDGAETIYAYLADVQTKLDLPDSNASKQIADRSIALVRDA
jgi:hypothetical protein